MSDMNVSSVGSGGGAMPSFSSSISINSSASITPTSSTTSGRPSAGGSVENATGLGTATGSSQSTGATSQAYSLTLENVHNNVMSALVLGLIASLFGDKDKKKDNDASAILGMMMLSAVQPDQSRISYQESFTSQTSQSLTTTNANAVQATSYSASGSATTSASVGTRMDVSA